MCFRRDAEVRVHWSQVQQKEGRCEKRILYIDKGGVGNINSEVEIDGERQERIEGE